jgi:hypothetical protein
MKLFPLLLVLGLSLFSLTACMGGGEGEEGEGAGVSQEEGDED